MPFPRFLFETREQAQRNTPFFIDEKGVGIWLFTDRTDLPDTLQLISVSRDAVHIPSVDQKGRPLDPDQRAAFRTEAIRIGLDQAHEATGFWTLSGSGALQAESVTIAFSSRSVDPNALLALAESILDQANQDAVAYEIDGAVQILARNP